MTKKAAASPEKASSEDPKERGGPSVLSQLTEEMYELSERLTVALERIDAFEQMPREAEAVEAVKLED